jgi:uncharacterized protein YlzI (FlbEa/FlbD family)
MMQSTINGKNQVTDEFVDVSLKKIAAIVKKIELAYIDYYDKQKS